MTKRKLATQPRVCDFDCCYHTAMDSMGTIPMVNGLYCLVNIGNESFSYHANIIAGKITISEVHQKLGHISHSAIRNTISTRQITRIELDMDLKPEFCNLYAKAKSARLPFPQKSDSCVENCGEKVHWDLWGPTLVRSLSRNYYGATCMNDHTHKNKFYFQIPLIPIKWMRLLLKCSLEIKSKSHIPIKGENSYQMK